MNTQEYAFRIAHALTKQGVVVFIRPSKRSDSFYLFLRRSRREERKGCFRVRISDHKLPRKYRPCDVNVYLDVERRGAEVVAADILDRFNEGGHLWFQ